MSGKLLLCGVLILLLFLTWAVLAQPEQRPARHPEFSDGFRAFKYENWREAANLMWEAETNWDEDGERTRVYGRWFEPYIPRYYLGVALYELGCYKEALDLFNRSLLSEKQIQGTRDEVETLESLKQKCVEYLRLGIEKRGNEDCSKWRLEADGEDEAPAQEGETDELDHGASK